MPSSLVFSVYTSIIVCGCLVSVAPELTTPLLVGNSLHTLVIYTHSHQHYSVCVFSGLAPELTTPPSGEFHTLVILSVTAANALISWHF